MCSDTRPSLAHNKHWYMAYQKLRLHCSTGVRDCQMPPGMGPLYVFTMGGQIWEIDTS
jgi:hypothetical protein